MFLKVIAFFLQKKKNFVKNAEKKLLTGVFLYLFIFKYCILTPIWNDYLNEKEGRIK